MRKPSLDLRTSFYIGGPEKALHKVPKYRWLNEAWNHYSMGERSLIYVFHDDDLVAVYNLRETYLRYCKEAYGPVLSFSRDPWPDFIVEFQYWARVIWGH